MKKITINKQSGFTLIELMIVVVIIGILAAIVTPSYQRYVTKTKRAEMMTDMVNIASNIESSKLAKGKYRDVNVNGYEVDYPAGSASLYSVEITAGNAVLTANWKITATPITTGAMANDGVLTYDYQGTKCRATTCGYNKEWNE